MQTRTRMGLGQTLRVLLVEEHEGVPAPIGEVDGERVPGEHALEPGVARNLFLRQSLATLVTTEAGLGRERRTPIAIELRRPVLAPLCRVRIVLGYLD